MNFFRKLAVVAPLIFVGSNAFAYEGAAANPAIGYGAFAAFLALGLAAFGSALGLGKAVTAVLEGISRNPNAADKMSVPMFVGFAFIEALTIYALVIAFMVNGKL